MHSFGFNSRLDDLHAAFLSVKLRHITAWTDQRRAWAKRYTDGLKGTSFKLPKEMPGYRHVFHLYVIEHHKRDHLSQFLIDHGIDAKQHYPIAIHQQEGYPWGKLADAHPHVPNAERNAAQCVSLPMFPELDRRGSGLHHRETQGVGREVRLVRASRRRRIVSAKKIYKVMVVGAGKRGKHHAVAFKNNPRFEVAGAGGC